MQLFYCDTNIISGSGCLNPSESYHCTKVLRYVEGNVIHVTDGQGNLYKAQLLNTDPKSCCFNVIETITQYNKRPYYNHIAIAPTKNIDRTEWFVEKAVEIGVDEISFMVSEHSERKIIKTDRIRKIAESAMKQSLKAYLPIINEITSIEQIIKKPYSESIKCIAYCDDNNRSLLAEVVNKKSNSVVLIGPEGDFSDAEIQLAIKYNFVPVSLGNSRLRTETAGIVACQILATKND